MHLAIHAGQTAVGIEHDGRVVIQARGTALEQRTDDHHSVPPRGFGQRLARGPGNRLGLFEAAMIFALARVLAREELLQADDVGAGGSRFTDSLDGFLNVSRLRGVSGHLDQRHLDGARPGVGMGRILLV